MFTSIMTCFYIGCQTSFVLGMTTFLAMAASCLAAPQYYIPVPQPQNFIPQVQVQPPGIFDGITRFFASIFGGNNGNQPTLNVNGVNVPVNNNGAPTGGFVGSNQGGFGGSNQGGFGGNNGFFGGLFGSSGGGYDVQVDVNNYNYPIYGRFDRLYANLNLYLFYLQVDRTEGNPVTCFPSLYLNYYLTTGNVSTNLLGTLRQTEKKPIILTIHFMRNNKCLHCQ